MQTACLCKNNEVFFVHSPLIIITLDILFIKKIILIFIFWYAVTILALTFLPLTISIYGIDIEQSYKPS